MRLIVLDTLAKQPRNAPWGLFAHARDQTRYGLTHYRPRSSIGSFLRDQLAATFGLETDMAYTAEEFKREAMRDLLDEVVRDPKHLKTALDRLVQEGRLRGLAPEIRTLLDRLLDEHRRRGLAPDEWPREPTPEEWLRGLSPEERLEGLDPAFVEAWLKQHPRHDR